MDDFLVCTTNYPNPRAQALEGQGPFGSAPPKRLLDPRLAMDSVRGTATRATSERCLLLLLLWLDASTISLNSLRAGPPPCIAGGTLERARLSPRGLRNSQLHRLFEAPVFVFLVLLTEECDQCRPAHGCAAAKPFPSGPLLGSSLADPLAPFFSAPAGRSLSSGIVDSV